MAVEGVRVAKAVHEAELLERAHVVGVAVGRKVAHGRETDETCIVVYVDHKEDEVELSRRDRVPRAFDGVRTDVVETGRFRALELLETVAMDHTRRMRPAPGGVSIAHAKVTAGTLGILAHRRSGEAVILSNNHVLANSNDARPGDAILQPGPYDGGRPQDAVASLAQFVPIQFRERELGRAKGTAPRGGAKATTRRGSGAAADEPAGIPPRGPAHSPSHSGYTAPTPSPPRSIPPGSKARPRS